MNSLKKREGDFLRLFLSTSETQRRALIKTISKSQLESLTSIVFNVLMGNRSLSKSDKTALLPHKTLIRRFVSKELTFEQRKALLLRYCQYFLRVARVIQRELH